MTGNRSPKTQVSTPVPSSHDDEPSTRILLRNEDGTLTPEPSTRVLLRGEDGELHMPASLPDERTTMTQSFRVRRGEARRVRQEKIREENLARPSALADAAFPAGVALLLSLQPVVDAVAAGAWGKAAAWLLVPATVVLLVVAPLSRRLDEVPE